VVKSYHFHSRTFYTITPVKINRKELQHVCPLRNFPHQVSSVSILAHAQVHAQAQISHLSGTTACWLTVLLDCRTKWLDPQTDML